MSDKILTRARPGRACPVCGSARRGCGWASQGRLICTVFPGGRPCPICDSTACRWASPRDVYCAAIGRSVRMASPSEVRAIRDRGNGAA